MLELFMSGIGQRGIHDNRSAGIAAINEMAGSDGVLADSDSVLLAFDFASDGNVANFAGFGPSREEVFGKFTESFALVVVGLFVDVYIFEVPVAEGFEHAFAFRTLNEFGDRQTVEGSFAVIALFYEDDLRAIAGHLRRERREPARAGSVARAGFLEFTGDFPRNFWSGRIVGVTGSSESESN